MQASARGLARPHPRRSHQYSSAITEQLRQASGGFPVARVRPMTQVVANSTAREDFNMLLLTTSEPPPSSWRPSASTASWPIPVQQRTQEMASAWLSAPIAPASAPSSSGTACASPSLASSSASARLRAHRFIASFLFGVKTWDPFVFVTVPVVFKPGRPARRLDARHPRLPPRPPASPPHRIAEQDI